MGKLKDYLPEPIRGVGFDILSFFQKWKWKRQGKPIPPPNKVKQDIVTEYGKKNNINILIETGTYLGSMIFSQRKCFKRIFSIELAHSFYVAAVKRFKRYPHIQIIEGNSADMLPVLVEQLNEPTLFWLDGHFSGGETAASLCPVMEELNTILRSPHHHIILIDDARCFNGKENYPTVDEIKDLFRDNTKRFDLKVETDIIRITYEL